MPVLKETSARLCLIGRRLGTLLFSTVNVYRIRGINLDKDAMVENTPANITIDK
jgi:hypothetical protein